MATECNSFCKSLTGQILGRSQLNHPADLKQDRDHCKMAAFDKYSGQQRAAPKPSTSRKHMSDMTIANLTVHLAAPRGFCAGVDRAIQIVERALALHGAPIYVRHEIVHNRYVVEDLESRGAVFVEELDEVPDGATVIFSAHGVAKAVPAEAERRGLRPINAACPLVTKVHREAEGHYAAGRQLVMIGHAGHPEVVGTMGQLPEGAITLVQSEADAAAFSARDGGEVAYITQTTLSVDDTKAIITKLKEQAPTLHEPRREDICYATTNRQMAVKTIAPECQAFLIVGAQNSSNSKRLVETAQTAGCANAWLVRGAEDIPWSKLAGVTDMGLSAGASAPEILVEQTLAALRERYNVHLKTWQVAEENIVFKMPRDLREPESV